MNMTKLGICEIRKISANELLKEKPKKLPFLKAVEEEKNNFCMIINRVDVFGIVNHELVYGNDYVVVKFYNARNEAISTLSVVGSNEYKEDEFLYISYGSIVSETSIRVMNGLLRS